MINYGVKACAKLCFYSKATGDLFAYFPFGNSMTIGVTGDKVEATAQGTTIITWAANRKATLQLSTNVISSKMLAIVLGATSETVASDTFAVFDSGKVGTSAATYTLSETPSSGTLSVFLTDTDGATVISELTATVSAPSEVQYSISSKTITVNSAHAGANILCIYAKDGSNLDKITIAGDKFAAAFEITGLGIVKGVDGVEHLQEIHIPSATAQSTADFTYDSANPSNFQFTFDLAADPTTMELFSFKSL